MIRLAAPTCAEIVDNIMAASFAIRQSETNSCRTIVADNLSKAGWSWGCVSAVDSRGQTIFIADAHRDDGQRFVVHADEKLTAFMELEAAVAVCR